jgi:hypothetical protein
MLAALIAAPQTDFKERRQRCIARVRAAALECDPAGVDTRSLKTR